MAKKDSSIIGWVAAAVASLLLYKYSSLTDTAPAGNSTAGIQSDAAATAMTSTNGDSAAARANHYVGPGRPWFGGPPIWVDENGDPIKVPPEDEPQSVVDYNFGPPSKHPPAGGGAFMEDTSPQPYPWQTPLDSTWKVF